MMQARLSRDGGQGLQTRWPVIVLNTHYSGLAIARDIGRIGVRVVGLTASPELPGNASRWLEYRPSPDSLSAPAALADFLATLATSLESPGILLPTRDHDVNFVAQYYDELRKHYLIAQPDRPVLDRVMNKESLAEIAGSLGLAVPNAVTIRDPGELPLARDLRFPCVCKPLYASQWRRAGVWDAVGRQKALRVDDYSALQGFYRGFAHLDPVVTVQEWVEGGEDALQIFGSYCNDRHDVLASFTARKRLQYPALAGTGIVVEALHLPPIVEPSRALLKALQFRGISEIEYKRDSRNGRLYLIEINPRHWDQHGLGTAVGVNLTEVLYRDLTSQTVRPMTQQPRPVRWIAETDYARHLVRCLLGKAPLADMSLALGAQRTWSLYDSEDRAPLMQQLGLRRDR